MSLGSSSREAQERLIHYHAQVYTGAKHTQGEVHEPFVPARSQEETPQEVDAGW